jgi:hypothetical protein
MLTKKNLIISDEEIEYLGELYLNLKGTTTITNFEDFVNKHFDEKFEGLTKGEERNGK